MMTHLGLHRIASATIGSISEMVRQHECCAYIKQEQFVWSTPIYARIFGKTDAQVRGVPYRSIMCQGTWDQRKRYLSKAMHGQSCHVYVMHHCTGDMLLESYVPNFTTTGTFGWRLCHGLSLQGVRHHHVLIIQERRIDVAANHPRE